MTLKSTSRRPEPRHGEMNKQEEEDARPTARRADSQSSWLLTRRNEAPIRCDISDLARDYRPVKEAIAGRTSCTSGRASCTSGCTSCTSGRPSRWTRDNQSDNNDDSRWSFRSMLDETVDIEQAPSLSEHWRRKSKAVEERAHPENGDFAVQRPQDWSPSDALGDSRKNALNIATRNASDVAAFQTHMHETFRRVEDMVQVHKVLFHFDSTSDRPSIDEKMYDQAQHVARTTFNALADLRQHFTRLTKDLQLSEREEASKSRDLRQVERFKDGERRKNEHLRDHKDKESSRLTCFTSQRDAFSHKESTLSDLDTSNNIFSQFDKRIEEIRSSLNAIANGDKVEWTSTKVLHQDEEETEDADDFPFEATRFQDDTEDKTSNASSRTERQEAKLQQLLQQLTCIKREREEEDDSCHFDRAGIDG